MHDHKPCDEHSNTSVIENPWEVLREFTTARIALGRVGISQPTRHQLAFQLAHAQARDAVSGNLDVARLKRDIDTLGVASIHTRSAAPDRETYLLRPDLGRRLVAQSVAEIKTHLRNEVADFDIAFVLADGLSATAVQSHAQPLLRYVVPELVARGWRIAPIAIVEQGRVAIGDEVGMLLGATVCAVLIGERPGLSAPDSLGVYLTYAPQPGRTDAERNCISNVRAAGQSYESAARTLIYLAVEARRRGLSGVALKNDASTAPTLHAPEAV